MLKVVCKCCLSKKNGRYNYIVKDNNEIVEMDKDSFAYKFGIELTDVCSIRELVDISNLRENTENNIKIENKFIRLTKSGIEVSDSEFDGCEHIYIIENNKLIELDKKKANNTEDKGLEDTNDSIKNIIHTENTDITTDNDELAIDFSEFKSVESKLRTDEGFKENCEKCKGTGRYTGLDGMTYICTCNSESDIKNVEDTKLVSVKGLTVTNGTKNAIVADGIIPKGRINDEFTEELCSELIKRSVPKGYAIRGFNKYIKQLNSIIVACKVDGGSIDGSYLIGGDNGFGKTTFVNTCLKHLYNRNRKVVPYVTLASLARLRAKEESDIRETIAHGYVKKYEEEVAEDDYFGIVCKKYAWNDYMSADVLFCSLGGVPSIRLESEILAEVLRIRGMRQLPTIVTTEHSLYTYINNKDLNESIWGNILNFDTKGRFDKLSHISCYKKKKTNSDMIIGTNM